MLKQIKIIIKRIRFFLLFLLLSVNVYGQNQIIQLSQSTKLMDFIIWSAFIMYVLFIFTKFLPKIIDTNKPIDDDDENNYGFEKDLTVEEQLIEQGRDLLKELSIPEKDNFEEELNIEQKPKNNKPDYHDSNFVDSYLNKKN